MVLGDRTPGSFGLAQLIDEYGDGLYPDLLFHFGCDLVEVVNGQGPAPSLVLALVRRLPDDCMTAALQAGGVEHLGWGTDRHLMANVFDALNQNTRACGNWGKKGPPKIPAFPRPKRKSKGKPHQTVAALHAAFLRG